MTNAHMKIAIHGRQVSEDRFPYIHRLFDELRQREAEVVLSQILFDQLHDTPVPCEEYPTYQGKDGVPPVDFVISVGGDGTLLETVTHVRNQEIPILGVNIGRLGFLATVSQDQIKEAVDALYQQRFTYDYRTLVSIDDSVPLDDNLNFALNELTIIKKDISAMIVVQAYVNDEYLNAYWADGLMIATPTGSTGYSLSCGGPVVTPQSRNLIITPVSPHNLTVRPLVIPDDSVISIKIEGRSENCLLSLDSRPYTINMTDKICIRKADFRVKLVKFAGDNFLNTLRQKLNWGLDVRN